MGTWYSKQQGCKDFPFNQVQMVAEIHHAISNESRHGKEAICTTRRACRADIPLWHLAMLPDYLLSDGGPNFRVGTYENLGINHLSNHISSGDESTWLITCYIPFYNQCLDDISNISLACYMLITNKIHSWEIDIHIQVDPQGTMRIGKNTNHSFTGLIIVDNG